MNQRKSKKIAKQYESRQFKAQKKHRTAKPLPESETIVFGKVRATIPYMDKMEDIVSLETQNAPIVFRPKPRLATKCLSYLLNRSGIESLTEIGDAITGKL